MPLETSPDYWTLAILAVVLAIAVVGMGIVVWLIMRRRRN
jgi:NADH:ubiquinone oxidoreductase subunit 3 (subunit A)